jgi:hypothetical protein
VSPVYIVANSIRAEVKERRERRKIKGKENRRESHPASFPLHNCPGKSKAKPIETNDHYC